MPRTLMLAVTLPAKAERLYSMFLDPALHSAFTGSPVDIAAHPGAKFEGFEGRLSGTVLNLVPGRLIVLAWRSVNFPADAVDSTVVLLFRDESDQCTIELTHVNVADEDYAGVSQGWEKYYWAPWRRYLEMNPI